MGVFRFEVQFSILTKKRQLFAYLVQNLPNQIKTNLR